MTVIIDKFDSLNSHHFSSSNQAQEEAFIPFTYSNIVVTMLKFDLPAAGLKNLLFNIILQPTEMPLKPPSLHPGEQCLPSSTRHYTIKC